VEKATKCGRKDVLDPKHASVVHGRFYDYLYSAVRIQSFMPSPLHARVVDVNAVKNTKQRSRYRPGVAQRFTGS